MSITTTQGGEFTNLEEHGNDHDGENCIAKNAKGVDATTGPGPRRLAEAARIRTDARTTDARAERGGGGGEGGGGGRLI